MAKKVFTDESLQTFVDEIKSYTDDAVSTKANSSHNHAASNITSGTLSSDRLPTVPIAKGGTGATSAAAALTNLGITATAAELNKMDGVTATTAELNLLDGVTATTAELNYVDGVTSNIQTQLNGKAASSHNQASSTINAMTGYSKPSSTSAIAATDTLNAAIGKLEKALDGKQASGSYAASSHNHSAANITSGTIAAARLPAATGSAAGITIVYPEASCTTFSSDSGTITPKAAQKAAKMFAITRPSATTNKAITRYSNTTGDVQDSKIIIEDVTNTRDTSKNAQVIAIPAEGGKKMVYGYCTDQIDGTSFIGGVFDADATEYPYSAGLAIGGTSGNLLWKGTKVATTADLSGYSTTSHTHKYAGSSSAGGSATSAVKLDTSTAGSATQPVYFSGGKPVACTYTLGKSVPSNAVFTDTTYSVVSTTADGLVPKRDGSTTKFLRADGTWAVPPDTNTTYSLSSFGITATAAELNKLDGVTATATELNYVDGVTSNIQTQLNGKAASGHTHSNYADKTYNTYSGMTAVGWYKIGTLSARTANAGAAATFAITNNYNNTEPATSVVDVVTRYQASDIVVRWACAGTGAFSKLGLVRTSAGVYDVYLYYNATASNNCYVESYVLTGTYSAVANGTLTKASSTPSFESSEDILTRTYALASEIKDSGSSSSAAGCVCEFDSGNISISGGSTYYSSKDSNSKWYWIWAFNPTTSVYMGIHIDWKALTTSNVVVQCGTATANTGNQYFLVKKDSSNRLYITTVSGQSTIKRVVGYY